ncbi:hypothetical protein PCE1_001644 [Barthelona sp. PCE]
MDYMFGIPTKLFIGPSSTKSVISFIPEGSKILLVFGGGSIMRNGCYDDIIELTNERNIELIEHGGCPPNPTVQFMREGAKKCLENNCGGILAVGGGSCADASKAMIGQCQLAKEDSEKDIWDDYYVTRLPAPEKTENTLPLYIIETISGTASLHNHGSVLSDPSINKKVSTRTLAWYAQASGVDPKYQLTVSRYQRECTIFDIFAHSFECIVMIAHMPSVPQSGFYHLIGLQKGLFSALDRYHSTDNEQELLNIHAELAYLAAFALNFSAYPQVFSGLNHLLGHGCTAYDSLVDGKTVNMTHGASLIQTMPAVIHLFDKYYPEVDGFVKYGKELFGDEVETSADFLRFYFDKVTTTIVEKNFTEFFKGEVPADFIPFLVDHYFDHAPGGLGMGKIPTREEITEALQLCL